MLVLSLLNLDVLVSRLRAAGCVFAEDEAALLLEAAHDGAHLEHLLAQRESGLPLEHVVGWAAFAGLRLHVAPGVFVPRRRSEHLARTAARLTRPGHTVLDLCCGCGAVGAALLEAVPGVRLYAADIDPAAVACARTNLPPAVHVYQGDLFHALPSALLEKVDLVVASPPYVPSAAIGLLPPEARLHEPLIALDGGADGLDVVRQLVSEAPQWLAPGGCLLLEMSEDQAAAAVAIVTRAGAQAHIVRCDRDDATVVVAGQHGSAPGTARRSE